MGEPLAVQHSQISISNEQGIQPDAIGLQRLLPDFEDYAYLYKPANILLVDNVLGHYQVLRSLVRGLWPEWAARITWVTDSAEAKELLHRAMDPKLSLPKLVAANFGALNPAGDARKSLEFVRYVVDTFGGVNVALYGSIELEDDMVEALLAMRASYLHLSDAESLLALALSLPFLARGHMLFSPTIAVQIPAVVGSGRPDPLNHDEWKFLKILADRSFTLDKLAPKLGYTVTRVNQISRSIAQKLREAEFIELDPDPSYRSGQYRDKLIAFYEKWHAHYARP